MHLVLAGVVVVAKGRQWHVLEHPINAQNLHAVCHRKRVQQNQSLVGCGSILGRPQRDHKIRPWSKGSNAAYEVTRAAPEVGCDLQNDNVRVLWDVVPRAMREEIWADRILEPDICVDQLATPAKLLMELPSPGVREDTRLFLVASVSARNC